MIRPAHPLAPPPQPLQIAPAGKTAYDGPFWMAYAATMLIMMAISLLFRYADFVTLLGGGEFQLGWIVGVGMFGSLAMRLVLGCGVDRYGPRRIWLGSLALMAVSCFLHLTVTTCHGPMIYLLRITYCCAIAGYFGASITFISGRTHDGRMAEMIGMLGTAGFIGMVLGTQLGDLILGTETIARAQVQQMFVIAGAVALLAMLFVYLATRRQPPPVPTRSVSLWQLLQRHRLGTVALAGMAVGVGLGLPGTFLRTFAAEMNIPRIGMFFVAYSAAAFSTRVLTRRLPERYGTSRMILFGLGGLAVSILLLLAVQSSWHLLIPGIAFGISHAILWPSVLAEGSCAFPREHRGLAIGLMLGTWDIGQLVGAPMIGAIVHYSPRAGLPAYPTMFLAVAALMVIAGSIYGLSKRQRVVVEKREVDTTQLTPGPTAELITIHQPLSTND